MIATIMNNVEKTIEVDVPLTIVYNQWTQVEEFPRFMEGIEEVRQLSDQRLHWKARVAGEVVEWDSEILELVRDERITWRSDHGTEKSRMVSFEALEADRTRITLTVTYEPDITAGDAGDMHHLVSHRINGDLRRFQEFMETRRSDTGGWRGDTQDSRIADELFRATVPRSVRIGP